MTALSAEPSTPSVYVVVVNWETWDLTRTCIASLRETDYDNLRVVVVDNGSHEDRRDELREMFPDGIFLRLPHNRGFAGGNNVGIREGLEHRADAIWMLNNDAEASPGALSAMVEVIASQPDVGIVGSVIHPAGDPGVVEAWGGGTFNRILGTTRRVLSPGKVTYIAGTSMLVRRETLESVGLLDETFFFFLEDVDYSYRAQQQGWRLAVAPDAVIHHRGGATVNRGAASRSLDADVFHARSTATFMRKHTGAWFLVTGPARLLFMLGVRVLRRQFSHLLPVARSFVLGSVARAGSTIT